MDNHSRCDKVEKSGRTELDEQYVTVAGSAAKKGGEMKKDAGFSMIISLRRIGR